MIRVLVVDDNPVVRSGLETVLGLDPGFEIAGVAGNGRSALEQAERLRPDLALLDVRMPVLDGITAAAPLSRICKVLMLTYADDPATVQATIRSGAIGYLVHGSFSSAELHRAIREAVWGTASPLSPAASLAVVEALQHPLVPDPPELGLSGRENEILTLMAQGRSNTEIARSLVLAGKTVENHINRIYTKLGVTHRAAAVARFLGLDRP